MNTKGKKLNYFQFKQKKTFALSLGPIVLVLLVASIFNRFSIYIIKGNSMFDTIKQGDTVLVWKKFKSQSAFQKNEIVLFYTEINDEIIPYVKRITAVPNDSIKASSVELIINGKSYPHDEIYYLISDNAKTKSREYLIYLMNQSIKCGKENSLRTETKSRSTILRIPNECYFLIGDNPYESMDSRFFGLIHEDRVLGKVIAVF